MKNTSTRIFRTAIITLVIAAFAAFAAAQSRTVTTNAVADRLGGYVDSCTSHMWGLLGEAMLLSTIDTNPYQIDCVFVGDTLTDINKNWTTEELEGDGYTRIPRAWADDYYPSEGVNTHLTGFVGRGAEVYVTLMVLPDEDLTIVILGYFRR